jgi:seryl-tRNA synthetase
MCSSLRNLLFNPFLLVVNVYKKGYLYFYFNYFNYQKMLQVSVIREQKERILEGLRKRNFKEEDLQVIDHIIAADDTRRSTQVSLDNLNAENNRISKEVGDLYKQGKREEADGLKAQVTASKEDIKQLEEALRVAETDLENLLLSVPNVPHESVPYGKTPEENEIFKTIADADLPVLPEDAIPHWELAKKYNIFDLELGVKLTGAGFPVFRGQGAKLQRALINFFLDEAFAAGYEEIVPPLLVNEESARGTGQLPDKEAQMYHCEKDNLYLIPTAEVPVTNILRDVILDEADFPVKMTGYTPCFRREAGSYGAHVRGLNRVHQFDKVEIVQAVHPDHSYDVLMEMVAHVESLMIKLELPYRILRLCGGDMGANSALTFDFEAYSAAQKRWLEVSSVSNFETFQSNRLRLRFRDKDKKMRLAHTLNGSALALARIIASLMENNQTPEGIKIPLALQRYMGTDMIK